MVKRGGPFDDRISEMGSEKERVDTISGLPCLKFCG